MLDHMTVQNGVQRAEQVNLRKKEKENIKKTPYRSRNANYKKGHNDGGMQNGFLQVQTAVNKAFKIVIFILKHYSFEIKTFA